MPAEDLFSWLDAIWTKRVPEGTPPTYMMHRFLAAEKDFAPVARELQTRVREPWLVFRIWQGLLPKGRSAPRLQYVAPKKPPQEEQLVARIRQVEGVRRRVVEEMIEIVKLAGRERALYKEYGVEPPK